MSDSKSIDRASAPGNDAGAAGPPAAKPRAQYAALPFRIDDAGEVEIMLITSRDTRRWIVPKGWPIKGLEPHQTAEREAFEEAGLRGHAAKRPIGRYVYEKRLRQSAVMCEVEVFPFAVTEQRKRWPERDQRDGRWFPLGEAAEAVREEELQRLIRSFDLAEAECGPRKRRKKAVGKAIGPKRAKRRTVRESGGE